MNISYTTLIATTEADDEETRGWYDPETHETKPRTDMAGAELETWHRKRREQKAQSTAPTALDRLFAQLAELDRLIAEAMAWLKTDQVAALAKIEKLTKIQRTVVKTLVTMRSGLGAKKP